MQVRTEPYLFTLLFFKSLSRLEGLGQPPLFAFFSLDRVFHKSRFPFLPVPGLPFIFFFFRTFFPTVRFRLSYP